MKFSIFNKNKNERINRVEKGYSVIELILMMGIFLTILGIGTINLLNVSKKSSISATVNSFVADFKEQQIKAMSGDTEGQASISDQGIHFETNSYTLFKESYGTSNFVVNLPSNMQFINPNTQIVFKRGSGEITGINSIVIRDTTDGTQKTITVNQYGVITGIN